MATYSKRLSDERLAEIRERAEKATKGPWHHHITGTHDDPDYSITQTNHVTRDVWTIPHKLDDIPFIANARQDIPDLLAEIDRLRLALELK